MTTIVSQCGNCTHVRQDGPSCEAFPDGIPDEVLTNELDHRGAIQGDNGIRWEGKAPESTHPLDDDGP